MRFPDNLRYKLCRDRLMRRRKVVVRTLKYLDSERKVVDTNRQWKNSLVRGNRRRLLDNLYGWYDLELEKIDAVLDRLTAPQSCREIAQKKGSRRFA
jgi:hypothetical protein